MAVKIRAAKFGDIPEIVRLATEAAGRSSYKDRAFVDPATVKRLAMECIGNHKAAPGPALIVVADNGTCLEGMLVGVVRPLYECMTIRMATNLIWYASENAHSASAVRLLRAFVKWVNRAQGPIICRFGISDAIGDPKRIGKLMEREGFRCNGAIFEKG